VWSSRTIAVTAWPFHAARCAEGRSAMRLEHLVLSNGNIFLPLSDLTQAQRRILDARSWSQIAAAVTPSVLAEGMGTTTFTPPRKAGPRARTR
jgi:hypothetical protein